jgi:HlyD family secretion protein
MRPFDDEPRGMIAEAYPDAHADEAAGPQGQALILELRRLQRALDHNWSDGAREAPPRSRQPKAEPRSNAKLKKNAKAARPSAGRRFASYLDWLGFGAKPVRREAAPSRKPPPQRPAQQRPAPQKPAPQRAPNPVDVELAPVNRPDAPPMLPPALRVSEFLELREQQHRQNHQDRDQPQAFDPGAEPRVPGAEPRVPGAEQHVPGAELRAPAPQPPAEVRKRDLSAVTGTAVAQLRAGCEFLINGSPGAAVADIPGETFSNRVGRAYLAELRTAFRVLIISGGVAGGWATLVPLSGAVVLPGTLVVESNVKKVQHPTGGVVADISVRDGMHVSAGSLLVRLDETQVRANGQMLVNQLDQTRMRAARLIAERDGTSEMRIPDNFTARMSDAGIAQLVASEKSQFKARAGARLGQTEVLQSNIGQFKEQIAGLEAQIASKTSQLTIIAGELTGVQELYSKGLVPLTRLTTLQREVARLEGERGQLTSSIAETKAKVGQAQLQIVKVDQDFRTEVLKDLREAQDKEAELTEKNVAAQDQLQRIDIRAPTAGTVNQLSVHTIGGVVRPGDVILEIVPDSDELQIEARLPTNEIDQVRRAQTAFLRFSAFNQRTTPQVEGAVSYVSADMSRDAQTNTSYYTVRVTLPGDERRRLGAVTLVAGMPVEVFLQTGSRTMLSYLLKPISDQFHRMFNER